MIMFCLWAVASALWVAFVLLAFLYDPRPNASSLYLPAMLLPPAILFAIGYLLRWVFTGKTR